MFVMMVERGRSTRQEEGAEAATSSAFENVFRSCFADVYRYTRSRLGPVEGEDVAAECFQAAAVLFDDGRGDEVTIKWLMSVARNKVIDRWRREATRRERFHLVGVGDHQNDEISELIARSARRDAVLAALDRLSHRHRALVILHHVEGRSAREIGDQLGISFVNVNSALARARRAFRRHYHEPEADCV